MSIKTHSNFLLHNSVLILLWFAFCFSESSIAQSVNPNTKKKGDFVTQDVIELNKIKQLKVKTRTKYAANYDLSGKMVPPKIASKEIFNRKGLLTQMEEFNGMGNIVAMYKFTYDAKNNPIKAESVESGGRTSLQVSKYDSRGNEIERRMTEKRRNKTETQMLFKYDKEDNLIETKNFYNNKLSDLLITTYNDGKRVGSIVKDDKGDTILTITPEYDSNAKLIKETRKNSSVNIVYTYKYDDKGNLTEMVDDQTKRYYNYDEKGNVSEHKMYLLDGRRQLRLVFKYSSNGLQNEVLRFDNNEKPVLNTSFKYEYYK